RKLIIDDETEFCGDKLLTSLLQCKSSFDELEGEEMRRARTRSNPYEMIRGVFFLNRAAMKMANIDHVFDYMFTNPKDAHGFLGGLSVIRTGGHFICKTFDLFTPFSVASFTCCTACFERVSLFKPLTSRPANSERYVVCRGLKDGIEDVRDYLFGVNLRLNQLRNSDRDVNLVVPLEVLRGDRQFFDYMVRSNESHCEVQIKALAKIHAFVQES
ncbi:hypothetical protein GDO86_019589, partial [Hymenochirus boettgeri]